jgi:hypothetical protein
MRNPIIVALDVPSVDDALNLVEQLAPVRAVSKSAANCSRLPGRKSCGKSARAARWFFSI